jgi:glutaminase
VMAVMATCGMYDAAGDWFTGVGIPAKSGVAGGLIGALPGQAGLATFAPRLDRHGNSVRGVRVFERLSRDMGMHLMEVPPPARSLVRGRTELPGGREGHGWAYELQGSVNFVGMERVLRYLVEEPPTEATVVLDLTRVHEVRDVGRRMLLEAIRRLVRDGHDVTLVDPEAVLEAFPDDHADGDVDAGDGVTVPVLRQR